MVGVTKLGSWFLLMLISFVLVSLVSPVRPPGSSVVRREEATSPMLSPSPVEG